MVRSQIRQHKALVIIIIFLCGLSFSVLLKEGYGKQKGKSRVNAPVFKKLYKGINIDTIIPENGVWPKFRHEAAHFEAAADAGFESVRIFMPYRANIKSKEAQIKDALKNNLAIVVCMWGMNSWSKKDPAIGAQQIAQKWRQLARLWKKYPKDLIFEVLNEPEGIGFKREEQHADVMQLYNAAVQAIREEDPDRPVLIGPPGYNDSKYLYPYLTEKYLTYTFDSGKGFLDDANRGVAIHFYSPKHKDGVNFAMWTQSLKGKTWKPAILYEITNASGWRDRIGVNIPIITTEWGCWQFPDRSDEELTEWLDYHMANFKKYDIGSMWYTGIQNNQRSFAIYNTELGWNQTVLDKLTGVKPAKLPRMNQVINSEFFKPDFAWLLTTDKITKEYIYGKEAISGISMLKLRVPPKTKGQLYQQTYKGQKMYKGAPGRTLLHLIKEQTYRISFTAKSDDGKGQMKILLRNVENRALLYDSYQTDKKWIIIGSEPKRYSRIYTHNAETVMDVRLEFDVGSRQQVLYLDKVEFIRN